MPAWRKSTRPALATSPFQRTPPEAPPTTEGYSVGGRVTYDRCGLGTVTAVTDDFIEVDFGADDVRRLPAGCPGLSPL